MTLTDAYLSMWKNAFTFDGRALRSEYWYAYLCNAIVLMILSVLIAIFDAFAILSTLYELAVIIPLLSLSIRRLHDISKSGWYWFIGCIPLVGWIIMLIWFCTDSTPGPNQYGPNPKGYGFSQQYGYDPVYQQSQYRSYEDSAHNTKDYKGPEL